MTNDPNSNSNSAQGETLAETTRPSHRVCVVGAGYVGLTAAACLANLGHQVRCLESDPRRLEMLRLGTIPIVEPDLEEMVQQERANDRLSFTDDPGLAMSDAEIVLLCVGTPPRPDGDPNLTYIANAARTVSQHALSDAVVVVKSTVPPGSCEAIELICQESAAEGITIRVASSPEFLRESRAVYDFLNPDRVVIGAADDDVSDMVASLYPAGVPVVRCDRRGAELVKYAANAFLAVKISFANEVASLCESLGTDSTAVLSGVGLDHRIGAEFLNPGPGYGGSCLPKDVSGFQALGKAMDVATPVVSAAQEGNNRARSSVVEKLEMALGGLSNKKIALLGLSFKSDTDDARDSPAVDLAQMFVSAGSIVSAYDPLARIDDLAINRVDSALEALEGVDAMVVATAWGEFKTLDPAVVAACMNGRTVFDAVGCLDLEAYYEQGLVVYGVGRGMPIQFHPVVWPPLKWAHTEESSQDDSSEGDELAVSNTSDSADPTQSDQLRAS